MLKRSAGISVLAVAAVMAPAIATAASIKLEDTVDQSGFNGGTLGEFPLTPDESFARETTPWDFTDQDYKKLTEIDSVSVALHLGSGDSLAGEVNFNEFTLALDGFNTGIKLNGDWVVTNNGTVFVTEVFTGSILNSDKILDALLEDGKLAGTILDSDPGDDFVSLGSSEGGSAFTTLVINGIVTGGGKDPNENPGGQPGNGGGGTVVPTPAAFGAGLFAMTFAAVRRRRPD